MGLILGIDLNDDYSQISCFSREIMDAEAIGLSEDENSCLIPSAICRERASGKWRIGQDAYAFALQGDGTMVDKPIKMLSRGGIATIGGVRFTAEDLLTVFVEQLLRLPKERYHEEEVDQLVFTVQEKTVETAGGLTRVAERLGIPRNKVHVITHSEAFLFYVLSQKKEIWTNEVCLFDLGENGLHFYEMDFLRGRNPKQVRATHEEMEERFSLDILDEESGCRMGDRILTSCAEKKLERKIISAVFLTGKGFERTDWAPDALRVICQKRRVFAGQNLFARGAAFLAFDSLQPTTAYPYVCLCEGRVAASVSLKVEYEGRERQLILVPAGSNWCEARASVELIPDDVRTLDFVVTPCMSPTPRHFLVSLDELPSRPNKATRIEVIVSFTSEEQMTVRVVDKGFGELFMGSDVVIRKDFQL
ncbi:MAG: hypothetical protein IKQ96_08525 [Lachnospiraceae bacterium]|nr:hypothetical protein [Lachnospiraceae bacterium]